MLYSNKDMPNRMNNATVFAPATTGNMGPGFDCLGMALDLWNKIQIKRAKNPKIRVVGQGASELSSGSDNLVYKAAERYFKEKKILMPSLSITCWNNIPLSRGLGSSSAAIITGLLGASAIDNETATDIELIWNLAVELEGHPDNITPSLFGGCQVVAKDEDKLIHAEISIPNKLRVVLFIPDRQVPTKLARDILPENISVDDAVYNMSRIALLINALETEKVGNLKIAMQDKLHQPMRMGIFPFMKPIFQSALNSGALGVFLSGAGPTILAISQGQEVSIAYEMADSANKAGISGEIKITSPTSKGAYISLGG